MRAWQPALPVVMIALVAAAGAIPLGAAETSEPAYAYKGLVPGVSTLEDVTDLLGPAPIDTQRADDLRYPASNRPELSDRLFFGGGELSLVTAASPDPRYANRAEIHERFGEPEARIVFQTQEYVDYTERGLRFIFDAEGETIGVIYFAPASRRVPAGHPSARISLRRDLPAARAVAPPDDFRVGAARVSISPRRFDDLTADAKENRIHLAEELFARAAVFQRGRTKLALVGVDVFGLGPWDLDRLRESLAAKGFDRVVIAMSHTHANVDTVGFYGYYPRRYASHVLRQTEAAVLQAADRMAPIDRLQTGSVEMPLAGGRVVDLVRNGRDPGIVDPTVSILQAIGADGRPIVNVVHLACHPEVIRLEDSRGLSPDFVGTLAAEVSRRLGGQTVFLNGALGGMLTPDHRFSTQEAAEAMGRRLARYVCEAARTARPSSRYDLWLHTRRVEYPITGESVRQFLENPPVPFQLRDGRVETEMNVMWIGDAQLVTVPGELLPEIGFEIMSHMRGGLRLIVGLANGELGYLVPEFDFHPGGYEERTGPGAAGGPITRAVGLELAPLEPP
ncbi:MAG: hypothetical protein HQ582_00310 [Planctomycetes bacterium]|nr:hypothetical protein [Planctomycetota bacterium]